MNVVTSTFHTGVLQKKPATRMLQRVLKQVSTSALPAATTRGAVAASSLARRTFASGSEGMMPYHNPVKFPHVRPDKIYRRPTEPVPNEPVCLPPFFPPSTVICVFRTHLLCFDGFTAPFAPPLRALCASASGGLPPRAADGGL